MSARGEEELRREDSAPATVDLIAALREVLGRDPGRPTRYVDAEEPPEPDFDPDYEADRAADRYEQWLDSHW